MFQAARLFPKRFVPGLWISGIVDAKSVDVALAEMTRCAQLGAVVCNINPFPNGNIGGNLPLWHELYKPIFQMACALKLAIMVHASCSCVEGLETTADFYLNAMTTAVCQLAVSTVFEDNPGINIVIAQAGGAIPFHLGRLRTLVCYKDKVDWDVVIRQLWWDTCLYGDEEMKFFVSVIPADRILQGYELFGACDGFDKAGNPAEDTGVRIIRVSNFHNIISSDQVQAIRRENIYRAYQLLPTWLEKAYAG